VNFTTLVNDTVLGNSTINPNNGNGPFTDFWIGVGKAIFYSIPILLALCLFVLVAAAMVVFQPILWTAMLIRPQDPDSVFNPNAELDYFTRTRCSGEIQLVYYFNRLFCGLNQRANEIGRILGWFGGFALSGHIINNMDNDFSSISTNAKDHNTLFFAKSVLIFHGITFASAMGGNLIGEAFNSCSRRNTQQILTRFTGLRAGIRRGADQVSTEEMTPMRSATEERDPEINRPRNDM
jgi:hypothetical protein